MWEFAARKPPIAVPSIACPPYLQPARNDPAAQMIPADAAAPVSAGCAPRCARRAPGRPPLATAGAGWKFGADGQNQSENACATTHEDLDWRNLVARAEPTDHSATHRIAGNRAWSGRRTRELLLRLPRDLRLTERFRIRNFWCAQIGEELPSWLLDRDIAVGRSAGEGALLVRLSVGLRSRR